MNYSVRPVLTASSHFWRNLLLGLLFTVSQTVLGLPEDREQPIHVTADKAVQQDDRVTYTGNVVIVQGTMRITANRVVVFSQNRKVQRIVATGDYAHFQQLPEPGADLIKARAHTITYHQGRDVIVLEKDAEVEQKGSTVRGERIDYLVSTQTVRAESGNAPVQMVLQPEVMNKDKTGEPPAEQADQPPADSSAGDSAQPQTRTP